MVYEGEFIDGARSGHGSIIYKLLRESGNEDRIYNPILSSLPSPLIEDDVRREFKALLTSDADMCDINLLVYTFGGLYTGEWQSGRAHGYGKLSLLVPLTDVNSENGNIALYDNEKQLFTFYEGRINNDMIVL